MKDNKYQEFMSHITLTPEMKERVMEAMEEEMEEMKLTDEVTAEEGIKVMEEESAKNNKEFETSDKPAGKTGGRRSFLRYGGFAVAACLILLVGTGLGASLSGSNHREENADLPAQTSQYADKNYDPVTGGDESYETEDYDYNAGEDDFEDVESMDEDLGYMPEEPSDSNVQTSQSISASGTKADVNQSKNADTKEDTSSGTEGPSAQEENNTISAEKLIYTCRVTVETENYQDSIRQIRESIKKCGGFIESEYEYGDGAGYNYNTSENMSTDVAIKHNKLIIRIPMNQYDSFVNGVSAFGNVTEKNQDVENITRIYKDTETRIKALKTQEKRLLQMMEKAQSISDMVTVEDRLTDVQAELESYQNSKSEMDSNINYGTVELSLHQVKRISEQSQTGFGERMKNRFLDGLEVIVEFFRGLILLAAFLLPLLPLVLIIVLVVRWIRKRKKAKKMDKEK